MSKTEFEQLLKEHRERLQQKKYNTISGFNDLFRVMQSMIENPSGQKFYTIPEMGFYEGIRYPLHRKNKVYAVTKSLKAGWIREITLPDSLKWGQKNYDDPDVTELMAQPNIDKGRNKSIKRMKKFKYYTVTDEGKRIYKNIKEILDGLA